MNQILIFALKQTTHFITPNVTKLTSAQLHYVQIFCTEVYANQQVLADTHSDRH
jgi:hypothetical protein